MTAPPEMRLAPEPRSARQARRFLEAHLEDDDRLQTAQLLVSELVNEAVLHAWAEVCLRLRRMGGRVRIEVVEQTGSRPVDPRHSAAATTGRRLKLLSAMAADWGATVNDDGTSKTVWFELV